MKKLKFFLLIIFLIFFLNIIFFNFSFATLYVIQDREGNIVMITNQDNVKANYLKLGYTFYILKEYKSSPETSETPETSQKISNIILINETYPKSFIQNNIEVINWTNYLSDPPSYYYVEGILKNITNKNIEYLRIKIIAYDSNNNLISIDECYSDPYNLVPNQEAFFKTLVKYNKNISKFEIKIIYD